MRAAAYASVSRYEAELDPQQEMYVAAPMWRAPEEDLSRACALDAEPGRPTPVSVQACALVLAAVQETVLVRACGLAWVAALFREQVAAKAPRQRAVAMPAAQPEGHELMVQ